MNPTDKQVRFITIIFILLHLLVGIGGPAGWVPTLYLYVLNLIAGSLIVGYWLRKQIIITQHIFEMREMSYVAFEALVIALSGYAILGAPVNSIVKAAQYSIAVMHLIGLIVFLIFMMTFKITKLF